MTVATSDIARLLQAAERSVLRASLILDVVDTYASASDPSASAEWITLWSVRIIRMIWVIGMRRKKSSSWIFRKPISC